tara:strand:- start:43 stop:690 length:648 start_codon:yes stop_codon:yes gene_type:complete
MDFECPICFSDCDNSWFVTKCGHLFHQNCLYTSISYENVCPICRIEIDQDSINPLYPHSYKKGKVHKKIKKHKNTGNMKKWLENVPVITKEDILQKLNEIGDIVDNGGSKYTEEKNLLKIIGLYSLRNEILDINFTGIDEYVLKKINDSFDLGRYILKNGTDIPYKMIDWENGIKFNKNVNKNDLPPSVQLSNIGLSSIQNIINNQLSNEKNIYK